LNFRDELTGVLIWMDMDALINSYAFVLWFLPALLIARYFAYLTVKYIKPISLQFFIVLALFASSFEMQLPFAIDNGLNALLFVYIGYYLFKANKKMIAIFLILFGQFRLHLY